MTRPLVPDATTPDLLASPSAQTSEPAGHPAAGLTLGLEDPFSPDAGRLIAQLWQELCGLYGPLEKFTPDETHGPGSAFVIARLDGLPVGCGALRPMTPGVAEIKRMFVRPEGRGAGIAHRLLMFLEETARRMDYRTIRLETGLRQPRAIHLYERSGYQRIPCYGCYAPDPLSVCFEKALPLCSLSREAGGPGLAHHLEVNPTGKQESRMAYEALEQHLIALGISSPRRGAPVLVRDEVWRQLGPQAGAHVPEIVRWFFARFGGWDFPEAAFYLDPCCQEEVMMGWFLDEPELLQTFEYTRETLPGDVVPISNDGADNHLAVGVGPGNSGVVYFHVHDAPLDTHLYVVHDSFEQFLNSLHREA